jgi:hypothetical protein
MAFIMNNGMVMAGGHTNGSIPSSEYEQSTFLSNNTVYTGRGAYYQQPVPIHFSR